MKKLILLFCISVLNIPSYAQSVHNLDFEILENETSKDWKIVGNGAHKVTFDQTISQHGRVSGSIESIDDNNAFKGLAYSIPADFGGKKIKLTGYIKTENVKDGWAGLWMRIDPQVGFDNMGSRGITGTTDWKKYEIELDFNSTAKTIVVGGILSGSGKIWVDNLNLTIDGKPLDKAPEKEFNLAQHDTEFDKGSKVSISELDDFDITNLELLGKVWGFLKYYHPEVGKGTYNWDYELFRILPKYLKGSTNTQRNDLLLKWINSLGDVPICESCKTPDMQAFMTPDLYWMRDTELSTDLREKLRFIQKNRFQGNHFYVDFSPGAKNPLFKNENPYESMPYPDEGFRLLTVFKYWNMIHYYFPYKYLTEKNWNTTLKEYIPVFINAKNELEFELATLQIIGDIKDTHANISAGNNAIEAEKGSFYPPVHVRFIENCLVVTDYYNPEMQPQIGLKVGDIITRINGTLVDDLVTEKLPFYPASNYPTQLRDISGDLLRSNTNSVDVHYISDDRELKKSIPLFEFKDLNYYSSYRIEPDSKCFKIMEGNIGYITLANIQDEDISSIKKQLKDTKGIIVDIRNYPSAFVVYSLGDFLVSNPTDFVKFIKGNVDYPGEFLPTESLQVGSDSSWSYNGKKVVVLINELSQSNAEFTAMAFRAGDKTTIVGSTTAAADGNISYFSLPGGLQTVISGIGVYYPDGTETQRVGVIPDVEVLPTIQGIKDGKDEPLEKAIDIINKV